MTFSHTLPPGPADAKGEAKANMSWASDWGGQAPTFAGGKTLGRFRETLAHVPSAMGPATGVWYRQEEGSGSCEDQERVPIQSPASWPTVPLVSCHSRQVGQDTVSAFQPLGHPPPWLRSWMPILLRLHLVHCR